MYRVGNYPMLVDAMIKGFYIAEWHLKCPKTGRIVQKQFPFYDAKLRVRSKKSRAFFSLKNDGISHA